MGNATLTPGQWHDVTLAWDLDEEVCRMRVDGADAGAALLQHKTLNGISYVRFRSAAKTVDTAGFLVDRVDVHIDDPYAPPCSPEDQRAHEEHYVATVVPQWHQTHR